MDREAALRRLGAARVGRLATADAGGVPHVVPFVFALHGETVYWAVDRKPKRSLDLRRIRNIRENPNVELVVDHYEDDWGKLWWVRARGTARLVEDEGERERALRLLASKYEPYRESPPPGPVVAVDLTGVSWWEAGAQPPLESGQPPRTPRRDAPRAPRRPRTRPRSP
ncbi:MAG TPA: TIGR03668 family PPOX class F420-dependent oxidoreductase [Actinomycetota bacterium]|nr:TIGR03668 family PPOX class F420-dependent oxidoreductase [Actinomycetota bacterium]